jgi:hypothetical protein
MHDANEPLSLLMLHAVLHAVEISLFIFLMMVLVDYVNLWTQGRLGAALRRGRTRQIFAATTLGLVPGCVGSFMAVTLYIRGMLSFGAIVGNMTASCGDAAFVMLAKFPETAVLLFGLLFVIGIAFAFVSDALVGRLGFIPHADCQEHAHHVEDAHCHPWPQGDVLAQLRHPHPLRLFYLTVMALVIAGVALGWLGTEGGWDWIRITILTLLCASSFVIATVPDHYLVEHIGGHIGRHHLPRILAWTLGTLVVLGLLQHFVDLEGLISGHIAYMLLIAAILGLIPDAGPQLIPVLLFADGLVPFSVLLVNSLVQDGHGLLPLISVSVRDAVLVKLLKLVLALGLGFGLYALGY